MERKLEESKLADSVCDWSWATLEKQKKKKSHIFINTFFFVTFNVLLIIKFIFEIKS